MDRNQLHSFYCNISLFWLGAPGRSFQVTSAPDLLVPNVTAVISLTVALSSSSDLHEQPWDAVLGVGFYL